MAPIGIWQPFRLAPESDSREGLSGAPFQRAPDVFEEVTAQGRAPSFPDILPQAVQQHENAIGKPFFKADFCLQPLSSTTMAALQDVFAGRLPRGIDSYTQALNYYTKTMADQSWLEISRLWVLERLWVLDHLERLPIIVQDCLVGASLLASGAFLGSAFAFPVIHILKHGATIAAGAYAQPTYLLTALKLAGYAIKLQAAAASLMICFVACMWLSTPLMAVRFRVLVKKDLHQIIQPAHEDALKTAESKLQKRLLHAQATEAILQSFSAQPPSSEAAKRWDLDYLEDFWERCNLPRYPLDQIPGQSPFPLNSGIEILTQAEKAKVWQESLQPALNRIHAYIRSLNHAHAEVTQILRAF